MLKAENVATKKLAEKFEKEVNILLRNNDELRKKIAMQEKALAILKKVCGNDAIAKLKRDDEFCKDL